jgi:hypothetical protein
MTLATLGFAVRSKLADLGGATRLFGRLLVLSPVTLARFGLVRDQIFFLGNLSLAIIAVSGLFVGFVLGLQGYYTLQRYGSSEALGLLVALSLVRELGPVVTALLFAGRAGTALTAEIGLMKAGEQLAAMEMMAVDPVRRVLAPRFWGGLIAMPLLGRGVQRGGHHRRVAGGCGDDRRGRRFVLEPDAGRRRGVAGRGQRRCQKHGVRRGRHVCGAVPGLCGAPHARRRVACHHPNGGHGLVTGVGP